ncbi:MAG: ATP-binding protein [Myxococcota bacterium]
MGTYDAARFSKALEGMSELVSTLPASFALFSVEHRLIACSDQFCEMFRLEDPLRKTSEEILGDRVSIERSLADALVSDTPIEQPTTVIEDLGITVDISLRPWRLPGGGVAGVLVKFADVTRLHAKERELEAVNEELRRVNQVLRERHQSRTAQNAELERLVNSLTVGVIVADRNANFVLFNREAAAILGVDTSDSLTGWPAHYGMFDAKGNPIEVEDLPLVRALLGETVLDELVLVRNSNFDGDIWLSVSARPLTGSENFAAVLVFSDVTQRMEIQRELEEFAYVASHDLQEPLRMVTSYLQLLDEDYGAELEDDARVYMDFAVDGAQRMQQLIKDILAFSRTGRQELQLDAVELSSLVDDVVTTLQVAIEESGGEIVSEMLPEVRGDASQLRQLLQNLLSNAFKFRHPDRTPRVSVSSTRIANAWRIAVQDNGIGLNPEYSAKVFRMFQRLHTREEYPGTGIGLALCKRIVQRHGGSIGIDSTPGEGATFWFTLPVMRGPNDD